MSINTATPRSADLAVGLLWHSVNSGNLGVGALTVSNLALARRAAAAAGVKARFRILGFEDVGEPHYVAGDDVELLALNTKAMVPGGSYWRSLGDLDCVLDIGGGDSFTDIYGSKRFGFLWLTKAMAIARRRPIVLSPQTIGPFSRQPHSGLASWAMNQSELIVARDPLSFDVAGRMAPTAKRLQAVDVAFALPFTRRKKGDPALLEVGVNVSGLLFNRGYSGANEFGMQVDYAEFTHKLISALASRPNVRVQLITHVHSNALPMDDDGRIADRLAAEVPGVVRVPNFASPSEAKSYISGLDFLVAGRMHACIAAFSSGVPVVPVAYSRKFSGLFQGVLEYDHIVPVNGLATDAAVDFTMDRFDRRASLVAEIAQAVQHVDGLLDGYVAELAQLFRRVARR
ncbi:polysaccharide pyruvyl transferase family protein [uncultured Phenylobacterium sp.]|uniref:polysaccharide pyruvyl transferase family protein n=1 Tax=uncultured Phenylobacterium sp. TaxID=349273 RepID=UPI0025D8B7D0|nr:polysaccharide pyruvyl transferase family protein [uncultured Phenylobacterium sp.]